MVEDIFKASLKKYALLKKKDRLILGVSGGPDSVCLLYQFFNIRRAYRLELVCAHFNHALREAADSEEDFIRGLCRRLQIRFISEKKDVRGLFNGDSLEQTARNLRFDFFLKCARQTKIKKIALAHHRDDLAETVLMRLIRGAGLNGLRGFLPKVKFKTVTLIRPLIDLNKDEILNWLESKNIPYCVDASNFEEKFLRNRIRWKLLPLLKEMNPNIVNNLSSLARNVSQDYDFIHSFAVRKFLALKKQQTHQAIYLNLEGLKELPPAVFNHLMRVAIGELKGNLRKIESRHVAELRDLVFKRPCASIVDLPGFSVKKEEKTLVIQSLIL